MFNPKAGGAYDGPRIVVSIVGVTVTRRSRVVLAVIALVASSLVACAKDEQAPETSTSVKVDGNSAFTFASPGGITVTGDPGVAAPGTDVSITTRSSPQPESTPETLT